MVKYWLDVTRKSVGCLRYSTHKNPFKYLSASVKAEINESQLPPPTKINQDTIDYLEKVSLVGFENEKAVKIVEDAIKFADQIFQVNTDGVEPMISVLEDECLRMREDIPKNEVTRNDLLSHATKCIEYYYVTPGGGYHTEEANQKSSQDQINTKTSS